MRFLSPLRISFMLMLAFAGGAFAKPEVGVDTSVFTRAESHSSSDGLILKAYMNRLIGPAPKRGEYALSRNNIEVGMSWDRWELSFLHRNDYNLGFHSDTLEFTYRNQNKLDIPPEQSFKADVHANQYQLTGVKLGHAFPVTDTITVWASAAYLHATESVSGYLGKAEDGSGGVVRCERMSSRNSCIELEGNLHTEYYYTDDPLFGLEVDPPTGDGYSIDIGASWKIRPDVTLEVQVSDALGAIYWADLPFTVADATSDRFVQDDEGVWQANPSYDGWGLTGDFTQDLTRRVELGARYDFHRYFAAYEYDDMGLESFHYVKGGYRFNQSWGLEGSVELQYGILGLNLLLPMGEVFIFVDDLQLDNSRNFGFGWNIRHQIY